MSVACQGLGASVWYPCKDHQSDEPDNGASLSMIVPDTLVLLVMEAYIKHKKIMMALQLIHGKLKILSTIITSFLTSANM